MRPAAPALLPVTVVRGRSRHDLVVPRHVPLAELVPALVAACGGRGDDHGGGEPGGFDLRTPVGARLDPEAGLAEQGVGDGALLVLAPRASEQPARPVDDPVEAVRAVVGARSPALDAPTRGLVACGGAVLVVGLTAGALLSLTGSPLSVTAGACALVVTAVTLVATGRLLGPAGVAGRAGRGRAREHACVLASVGLAVPGAVLLGGPRVGWLAGGTAACAVALVALARLGRLPGLRVLPASVALTGAVVATVGLADLLAPAVEATTRGPLAAVVLAVAVAGGVPARALPAVGLHAPVLLADRTGRAGGPAPVTAEAAADPPDAAVAAAHDLVLVSVAVLGLLLVLASPAAVATGWSAVALVVAASTATLLRSRRHRPRDLALTGTAAGAAGLVAVTLALLVLAPASRPVVVAVLLPLTAVAVVLLGSRGPGAHPSAAGRGASAASVRGGRLADLAEAACVVGLLPLLAVAAGLLDLARGR